MKSRILSRAQQIRLAGEYLAANDPEMFARLIADYYGDEGFRAMCDSAYLKRGK
jgi:hypothetical protein